MWVPTRAFLKGLCAGMGSNTITTGTDLFGCFLGLFTNVYSPNVNTLLANLTEATYTGYVRGAITWNAPFIGEGALSLIEGTKVDFRPSDTITPNTIQGAFIVGSDSVTLLLVEVLPTPVPLTSADYLLAYIPRVGLDPGANYGLSVVAN